MSSAFVFEGLKMHFKARGITYADVARALKISEATVKRIFAVKNCSLERLDSQLRLKYVPYLDPGPSPPAFSSLTEVPDLGLARGVRHALTSARSG